MWIVIGMVVIYLIYTIFHYYYTTIIAAVVLAAFAAFMIYFFNRRGSQRDFLNLKSQARESNEFKSMMQATESLAAAKTDGISIELSFKEASEKRYNNAYFTREDALITFEIKSRSAADLCIRANREIRESLESSKWRWNNNPATVTGADIQRELDKIEERKRQLNRQLLNLLFGGNRPEPDWYFNNIIFELTSDIDPLCRVSGDTLYLEMRVIHTSQKKFNQEHSYTTAFMDVAAQELKSRYPSLRVSYNKTPERTVRQ